MKKTIVIAVSLVCFLLLGFVANVPKAVASAPKGEWKMKWDKLVEAAKKEGEVMVYGRGDPGLRKTLTKAFGDKYGIKLEFLYMHRGGEMAARMKKERGAGKYLADVTIHGPTTSVLLIKSAGMLDPLHPELILPEVLDPKAWMSGYDYVDKDRTVRQLRALFMRYITINTERVKEGEIKSYKDLLNPKWKGKIVMYDPTRPGTANGMSAFLNGIWGTEKLTDYFKQLVKQEPVVTRESRVPLEGVARGKYAIGIAMRNEVIPEFLKIKAPIALVQTVEGGQLGPGAGCLGLVNKRPHPNAAAVFVNWLLSKEGMTLFSKGDGYPVARMDVDSSGWVPEIFVPGPGEKIWFETEEGIYFRRKLMAISKEVFAPVMKKMKKKK